METDTMDKPCPELQSEKVGGKDYCKYFDMTCTQEYGYECVYYENWLKGES